MHTSAPCRPQAPSRPRHCAHFLWDPDLSSSLHSLPKNSLLPSPRRPPGPNPNPQGPPFPFAISTASLPPPPTPAVWLWPDLTPDHLRPLQPCPTSPLNCGLGQVKQRLPPVSLSRDRQSKLPRSGHLKTNGTFSLKVPEARSPESRCGRAVLPPQAPEEGPSCLF